MPEKSNEWAKERDSFFEKIRKNIYLADHQTFLKIDSGLGEVHGRNKNIMTFAMALVDEKSGWKQIIIDAETIRKFAKDQEEFEKFIKAIETHELFEVWYIEKPGFNLKKDLKQKIQRGERPKAHFLAIRRELEEAEKLGVLDSYAESIRRFLEKSIERLAEAGKPTKLQEENLTARIKEYEKIKQRRIKSGGENAK